MKGPHERPQKGFSSTGEHGFDPVSREVVHVCACKKERIRARDRCAERETDRLSDSVVLILEQTH